LKRYLLKTSKPNSTKERIFKNNSLPKLPSTDVLASSN
jgi:hypothetical protein